MQRLVYAVRTIFGTTRGRSWLAANTLVAFGLTSAMVQFAGQFFPGSLPSALVVTGGCAAACLVWGMVRAYPRRVVRRDFKHPEMSVVIEVGDLFAQSDAHLVIGFTDTFDTSIENDLIIHRTSVQGQMLQRIYGGDQPLLDRELDLALQGVAVESTETVQSKPHGNLDRYPRGTVAVLGTPQRRLFGVAYGRMGNDLIVRASLDDIWHSLNTLWESIYRSGYRETVAMPLVGSGLARINHLERESLLKMIVLSFVASSRQRLICKELRIMVWAPDLDRVNLLEVQAFLRNL